MSAASLSMHQGGWTRRRSGQPEGLFLASLPASPRNSYLIVDFLSVLRRNTTKRERQQMRVLVTGHLGYIGTILTPMLVQAGHQVVGLDSDLYTRCTFPQGGGILQV